MHTLRHPSTTDFNHCFFVDPTINLNADSSWTIDSNYGFPIFNSTRHRKIRLYYAFTGDRRDSNGKSAACECFVGGRNHVPYCGATIAVVVVLVFGTVCVCPHTVYYVTKTHALVSPLSHTPISPPPLSHHHTGHGTHTSGSAVGAPVNGNQYEGMAPDAKIAFWDLGRGGVDTIVPPADLNSDYYPVSYSVGARVHSDSWGSSSIAYDELAAQVDMFSWAHPVRLLCVVCWWGNDVYDHVTFMVSQQHPHPPPPPPQHIFTSSSLPTGFPPHVCCWQ